MNVSDIMTRSVQTASPETLLERAQTILEEGHFRHLPILEDGGLAGVLTDRDLLEATGWLPARVHACRGPVEAERVPIKVHEILRRGGPSVQPSTELLDACVLMVGSRVDGLPVLEEGRLVGLLTEMDVIQAYAKAGLPRAESVTSHMSRSPTTVSWFSTLAEAQDLLLANGYRHLPVLECDDLVGMISERDLCRAKGCGRSGDLPVGEVMSSDPVLVSTSDDLGEAVAKFVQFPISSLPVVDGRELVGILTTSDVLEACLDVLGPSPEGGRAAS